MFKCAAKQKHGSVNLIKHEKFVDVCGKIILFFFSRLYILVIPRLIWLSVCGFKCVVFIFSLID